MGESGVKPGSRHTRPGKRAAVKKTPKNVQMVVNGGFEDEGRGWVYSGVDFPFAAEETSHQGVTSARLGFQTQYASLKQTIPGVKPGQSYQFGFSAAGFKDFSNTVLFVSLLFLDARKKTIGAPALDFYIEQMVLPQWYMNYLNYTPPAPPGARYARIEFSLEIQGSDIKDNEEHVRVDDVLLVPIG